MVPQRFNPALRHRERNTSVCIDKAVAATDQFGAAGVLAGVVIDPLRCRSGAASGVNRHLVAVRVRFEHRDLTRRQTYFVLVQIGLGDGEQRRVCAKGIDMRFAGAFVTRRRLGETTTPGRNGARRVASLFSAQWGQAFIPRSSVRGLDSVGRQRQDKGDCH